MELSWNGHWSCNECGSRKIVLGIHRAGDGPDETQWFCRTCWRRRKKRKTVNLKNAGRKAVAMRFIQFVPCDMSDTLKVESGSAALDGMGIVISVSLHTEGGYELLERTASTLREQLGLPITVEDMLAAWEFRRRQNDVFN